MGPWIPHFGTSEKLIIRSASHGCDSAAAETINALIYQLMACSDYTNE